MSTPLPPDPYVALGVDKNATAAQIKTTYRKLVLRCHPDKVIDESRKADAADQFHRIQQAYEILSDEGRRSRYDAQIKLVELRKQAMNGRPPVEVKTAAYEMPTSSPGRSAFTARGPERVYEERRPDKSDSDPDYFSSRTASRKHEGYERPTKKAAPRDDRDRAKVFEREKKESERVLRNDKRRTRDKENQRERDRKLSYADDDSEADLMYEARRKREAESRRREEEQQERDRAERARAAREREHRERDERERKREREDRERERERSRRGYDKTHYDSQLDGARAYQASSKRPSIARATSSRGDIYVDRSSDRPAYVMRRNSTKPSAASPQPSSHRERKPSVADIPESLDDRRTAARPSTQPRERGMPGRSMSMQQDERDVRDPPPTMRRADTMPANISPRRTKEPRSSNLRSTEFSEGYPTPSASPDYPTTPLYTKSYRYADDDTYRHTDRDRERNRDHDRHYTRSPSPIGKRPSAAASSSRYRPSAPQPPPISTSNYTYTPTTESPGAKSRPSPQRRETLYGETPKATTPKTTTKTYEYPIDSHRDYDKERYKRSPVIDADFLPRKMAPEDVRIATDYGPTRRSASAAHHSSARPGLPRHHTASGYAQPIY